MEKWGIGAFSEGYEGMVGLKLIQFIGDFPSFVAIVFII
jgi:hypothetical protein